MCFCCLLGCGRGACWFQFACLFYFWAGCFLGALAWFWDVGLLWYDFFWLFGLIVFVLFVVWCGWVGCYVVVVWRCFCVGLDAPLVCCGWCLFSVGWFGLAWACCV